MRLLKCPKCGEMFSDTYKTCPFCQEDEELHSGKPVKTGGRRVGGAKARPKVGGGVVVACLVLVLGLVACTIFGILFHLAGEEVMTILAVVSVGALIPFFLHNVFGKSSKMFIGDGGTLVMGTVMSVFVIAILQSGSRVAAFVDPNVGLVPFTLAVLSVPVFDTLRVMSTRMLKGSSPFRPDKTHLHHMFIDMGCSHVATTLAILGLNTAVVLCWWAFEAAGFSIAVQLYAVVGMSLLATFGLYHFMQWHIRRDTKFMGIIRRLGYKTHISRTGIFFWLQQVMDKV